eukprot:gene15030-17763_t
MRADKQAREPTNTRVMTSTHVARINEYNTVGGRLLQETESKDPLKPGMEDHEELVKLTEEGADPMRTGRYGIKGPLEALEYFTTMSAYVLPFMHCMTYGAVKGTVKMFRHKVPNCKDFNAAQLKQLQKNNKGLCAPHDMHREYQDVVQYAGNYTMEDWLNFAQNWVLVSDESLQNTISMQSFWKCLKFADFKTLSLTRRPRRTDFDHFDVSRRPG